MFTAIWRITTVCRCHVCQHTTTFLC
jgi:hypothetical protein